jgi:hypothetical protein
MMMSNPMPLKSFPNSSQRIPKLPSEPVREIKTNSDTISSLIEFLIALSENLKLAIEHERFLASRMLSGCAIVLRFISKRWTLDRKLNAAKLLPQFSGDIATLDN